MKVLQFSDQALSSEESRKRCSEIVFQDFETNGRSIISASGEGLSKEIGLSKKPFKLIENFQNDGKGEDSLFSEQAIYLITSGEQAGAAVASTLGASELEIWTELDSLMTADPKKVPKALPIDSVSYKEALELSQFGTKDIHPTAILEAASANITIRLRNINHPECSGSLISSNSSETGNEVTGITSLSDIALLRVEGAGLIGAPGAARRVFKALHEELINVILISQASSEHSICFALSRNTAQKACKALNREFAPEISSGSVHSVEPGDKMSIISVVGEKMRQSPGLAKKVFQALGQNGINAFAIAQGSSELNLSVVVSENDETKALRALHDSFFSAKLKTINLFCVGTGQVGSTLLDQIAAHSLQLKDNDSLELRLVGVANSKKMLVDESGINQEQWREGLEKKGQDISSVGDYISQIKKLNLANSIFVDNTAHEIVSDHYEDVLSHSISVVTPNKKANSSSLERFYRLQEIAKTANVNFFYETNVGAGLPVIETLKDLMRSGDKVVSIEAVLSGTLSYIFNSFDGSSTFSDVVVEAKKNGYTEPDPRDDLSGMDVARKLLILGREMGRPLEEADVEIESLIPDCASNANSVEEFLKQLKLADEEFENKRSIAADKGQKLVYLARVDQESASVSLQAVGPEHPFASLSGSDNIISFVTERYNVCPLVVKGPGAGTQVTAAGVFADIIKAASYLV